MMLQRLVPLLLFAVVLAGGCKIGPLDALDAGGADAVSPDAWAGCPKGTKAKGAACEPIFDRTCKDDEVPQPDGGCKKVGVEECKDPTTGQPGIKGPPSWTCKLIGPPAKCLTGWQKVKEGWCEPQQPPAKCTNGTMEVLGKPTCQPIRECGTGTWGKIATTSATIFVDASYRGKDSDGSQAKPFVTIAAALAKGGSSPHIALAAGTYEEAVTLKADSTVLDGRCPEKVTIKGPSSASAAVGITGTGVTVRGVTITGPGLGLHVAGDMAAVEQVAIAGCGAVGARVYSSATFKDALVAASEGHGIHVSKSAVGTPTLKLERVVVRDTTGKSIYPDYGQGVLVEKVGAKLEVTDSLITENTYSGIQAYGSVTIQRSLVVNTLAVTSEVVGAGLRVYTLTVHKPRLDVDLLDSVVKGNDLGVSVRGAVDLTVDRSVVGAKSFTGPSDYHGGIWSFSASKTIGPSLTIRDSLLARGPNVNVLLKGADALVERTVVRDNGESGLAAYAYSDRPSKLTARDTLFSGNGYAGARLHQASDGTFERCIFQDTKPIEYKWAGGSEYRGNGIRSSKSKAVVRDCRFSRNSGKAVMAFEGPFELSRTIVEGTTDTRTDPKYKLYPTGVWAGSDSGATALGTITITDVIVAKNAGRGVGIFRSNAEIKRLVVRDTLPWKNEGLGYGVVVASDSTKNTVKLSESIIDGNVHGGVQVVGPATVTLRGSVLSRTKAGTKGLGDGLQVMTYNKTLVPTVTVQACLVDANARAGVLFDGARGGFDHSVLRNNKYGAAMQNGAQATLGPSNVLEGNQQDSASKRLAVPALVTVY